ncbi:MAG: hypothetical protein WCR27_03075 [Eubacteriales bacterium]
MFNKLSNAIFKWEWVYYTYNVEEYTRIREKLITNGIKIKTKILNYKDTRKEVENGFQDSSNYLIRVQNKNVNRANEIINND